MTYIIMDLEWNNVYSKQLGSVFNEVLEIGAVAADENMEIISTFSELVRSRYTTKIKGKIKELTHITNEDMYHGVDFSQAVSDFSSWTLKMNALDGGCVFMSWGNADIRVLLENIHLIRGYDFIPFIKKYVDLQGYCRDALGLDQTKQPGLSAAATMLGIDPTVYSTHRALEDSLLAHRCLKQSYSPERIERFTRVCDNKFYAQFLYKPRYITSLRDPKLDKSKMTCFCDRCKLPMKRLSPWKTVNKSFRAVFRCAACSSLALFTIQFKVRGDEVVTKSRMTPLRPDDPRAEQYL